MRGGALRLYGRDLARLQRVIDPLAAGSLFCLIPLWRGDPLPPLLLWPGVLSVVLSTVVFLEQAKVYGTYRQSSLLTLLRRLTTGWVFVFTSVLVFGFVTQVTASFSRIDVGLWAVLTWLFLALTHVGGRKLLRLHRIHGGNVRTALFWGSPESAIDFHQQLEHLPYLGLRLIAWFRPPDGPLPPLPPGLPECGGGLIELRRWLDLNDVDQIYFSYVSDQNLSMKELIRFFGDTCKPVHFVPPWSHPSMRFQVGQIGSQFVIGLWGREESLIDRQLKRQVDLVLAGAALIILAPLLLLLAMLVALTSPGPVLFHQDRYGLDGRRFKITKFRTMTVTESGDQPGLQQARRGDPRITPIGRSLRRWSLDELPQLFNVLAGSMSLVGPRPHAVDHNEFYRKVIPGYMQRHQFKPGMTGLAQVEGWRGETADLEAMANRIEADLRYLREWSIGLDLKILIKTLLHIRSPNAF